MTAEHGQPVLEKRRQLHPRLPARDIDLGGDRRLDDLGEPEREKREIGGAEPQYENTDEKAEEPTQQCA